jgi:rare lipoprotein A
MGSTTGYRCWLCATDQYGGENSKMIRLIIVAALVVIITSSAYASQIGNASYYGSRHGGLTAAHRTLAFGTRVLVTNLANGRAVTVVINDRGPFIRGRVIDVSIGAAQALGIIGVGIALVRIDPM